MKNYDVFEDGKVKFDNKYSNAPYLTKKQLRIENRINRRAWKNTYKDSRFLNDSRLVNRGYSRLNSSSYWYDFGLSNFRSLLVIFLLFIGFYMVVMADSGNLDNINPFESGITILQEISDLGFDAKANMVNFVKSINSWTTGEGDFELNVPIFNNALTKLIRSIFYSLGAIWNFLKFIFRLLLLIFRILLGGL